MSIVYDKLYFLWVCRRIYLHFIKIYNWSVCPDLINFILPKSMYFYPFKTNRLGLVLKLGLKYYILHETKCVNNKLIHFIMGGRMPKHFLISV